MRHVHKQRTHHTRTNCAKLGALQELEEEAHVLVQHKTAVIRALCTGEVQGNGEGCRCGAAKGHALQRRRG